MDKFSTVTIRCERFSVSFGAVELKQAVCLAGPGA
ncbi:hypothetical protein H4W80_010656 [Nonomuraea angiospora]|uniref:DM13 domain-containing protein n=1 Tax=Nonomuraea angiospora TaxID=46172 RepID=A0ABR9MHK8_9ACTN|nr:hypothetical protein [Nonomuraea angiospora]